MVRDNLSPGVHLMQGDRVVKSLSLTDYDSWRAIGYGGGNESAETLLSMVGWVYTAIIYRRNQLGEVPYSWQRNGDDVDAPPVPIPVDVFGRIDQALQLGSVAYLHKEKNGSGRTLRLRWLDPAACSPINTTYTEDDYGFYSYYSEDGSYSVIPREDLIIFRLRGLRERDAMTSASSATALAAQILHGMEATADGFYETNGLPLIAVIVPDTTATDEVKRVERRFGRLFRQRRQAADGNKTVGLRENTDIKVISFAPKDLAMRELEDSKKEAVLVAHEVPPAVVYKDVNLAEAQEKKRHFVGVMAARLDFIARELNADPDLQRIRVRLDVRIEQHYSMRRDEDKVSQAFVRYKQGGFTPEAAAFIVGITEEDFPEEMRGNIWRDVSADNVFGGQFGRTPADPLESAEKAAREVLPVDRPFQGRYP